MGFLLKVLIVFGVLYFGYRMVTKPFRDYVKAAQKQAKMREKQSQNPNKKSETKTENVGEYIDYEEIE